MDQSQAAPGDSLTEHGQITLQLVFLLGLIHAPIPLLQRKRRGS